MSDGADLEARLNAMLRDEVRAWWEQSGRHFGRAAPPRPTLHVERASGGELAVRVDEFGGIDWVFPWDGSDVKLRDWMEVAAEDCWSTYVEREYGRRPPS